MSVADPGTTYTLAKANWAYLPYVAGKKGKLIVSGHSGNEAGAGKGVRLYNQTDTATLGEITWNGSLTQPSAESAEFTFPAAGKNLRIECKGTSATEDLGFCNVLIVIY